MSDDTNAASTERVTALFVCTANICRSPALQFAASGSEALVPSSVGIRAHAGSRICPLVAEQLSASAEGATFAEEFRSRTIFEVLLEEYTLVLTATAAIRRELVIKRPALRARVFTVREAIALSSTAPKAADEAVRAREGFAAALSRRRGSAPVAPTGPEGRRLFRRSTATIDLSDVHDRSRGRDHLRGIASALDAGQRLRLNFERWCSTTE